MAEQTQSVPAEKKVKARAIHHIHHGDHDNHIKSGQEFMVPESQVKRLIELGAAEVVVEKVAAPAVVTK
jgi:hypothetical protein